MEQGNQESQTSVTPSPKLIYRSEKNRVIGGVAGGLGEYLNIDPVLIRILFLIFFIFEGVGLLLYLILWVAIPSESNVKAQVSFENTIRENAEEIKNKAQSAVGQEGANSQGWQMSGRTNWSGYLLIILGLWFLFRNMGYLTFLSFTQLWPILIIVVGLLILFK